jgi:hypothetical protein
VVAGRDQQEAEVGPEHRGGGEDEDVVEGQPRPRARAARTRVASSRGLNGLTM